MNHDILMEKIVQSLALEVEAVKNDGIVKLTGASRQTPLKVKVKVRKKDKDNTYDGFISVPKHHPTGTTIDKIRIADSDQTIMSFDMFMDTDQEVITRKPRNKFFHLLRPGLCLGKANNEKDSYQPSHSHNNSTITSTPDEVLKKHLALTKNDYLEITTAVSKRQQNFLGKCKPGGCLDPPFSEDKYSYKPIGVSTSTYSPKNLCLDDDTRIPKEVSVLKSMSKEKISGSNTDLNQNKQPPQTNSILNLYQAESVNTSLSLTYSNSIITYPPPLTSSEIRLNNERSAQQRISIDNRLKKSFNEFSQTYFIPPKDITHYLESNDSDKGKLCPKDENNALCQIGETNSSIPNTENQYKDIIKILALPTPTGKSEKVENNNIKASPAVDKLIVKNQDAVDNSNPEGTVADCDNDKEKRFPLETKPVISKTCVLKSQEITLKSESITLNSIDTLLKPSVRSSLAETHLNINKTFPQQLALKENDILEVSNMLQQAQESMNTSTEKEPYVYNDGIVSDIIMSTPLRKSSVNDNFNVQSKRGEHVPATLENKLPVEPITDCQNATYSNAVANLDIRKKDDFIAQDVSSKDVVLYRNIDGVRPESEKIIATADSSTDKRLNNDTLNEEYNFDIQNEDNNFDIQNEGKKFKDLNKSKIVPLSLLLPENDDSDLNLENTAEATTLPSTVMPSPVDQKTKIETHKQHKFDESEIEEIAKKNSQLIPGFQEVYSDVETHLSIQTKINEDISSRTFPLPQPVILSNNETLSFPAEIALQNQKSVYKNIEKVIAPSKEAILKDNIAPLLETNENLTSQKNYTEGLLKEKLYSDDSVLEGVVKDQSEKLFHDIENQLNKHDINEDHRPTSVIDRTVRESLEMEAKPIEMVDTMNKTLDTDLNTEMFDMSKTTPYFDTENDNQEPGKPNEILIPISVIDYSSTQRISETMDIEDISKQEISQNTVFQLQLMDEALKHEPEGSMDKTSLTQDLESSTIDILLRQSPIDKTLLTKGIEKSIDETLLIYNPEISNQIIPNALIAEEPINIPNKAFIQHTTHSSTLSPNISNEGADLAWETGEISETTYIKIGPLDTPIKLSILKEGQNGIDEANKGDESHLKKSKSERESTIFDVTAFPDPKKLKEDIAALKNHTVLYTPSENTLLEVLKKDTVTVDVAFHSYVNDKRERVIKTFDSEKQPERYAGDRLTVIKSNIDVSNNVMKIPIDSENSLLVEIKKAKKMDNSQQIVSKEVEQMSFDKGVYTKKIYRAELNDGNISTLNAIYETELLPLQNTIKNLKEDIDHLAGYSLVLKDDLFKRKLKPLRLTNVNKKCVCFKRLF